jgi:ribosomal protein L16 Arg81 hydroxylase
VFILQLHGVKEWHISGPRDELPLVSMKQSLAELPNNFRKLTLRPGDVLYLPRGFLHYANTEASSSLHLTVRIEVYRWVDFLCETLRALAEEQVEFRNALPPGFLDMSLNSAHMGKLTECFVRSISNPEFVEQAKVRLGTKLLQASKVASTSQFASIDALSSLSIASVVTRSPGLLCRVRRTSNAAVIEFSGNFISGPVSLESTLKFVAEHEQFVVGDLPGELSVADKIDLVVYMVSEGLLQLRH